jgi:hypothetical protein
MSCRGSHAHRQSRSPRLGQPLLVLLAFAVDRRQARADRGGVAGVVLHRRDRDHGVGGVALGAQRLQDLEVPAGLTEGDQVGLGGRAAAGRAQRLGRGDRGGGSGRGKQREL